MAKRKSWHFYTFLITASLLITVHVLWNYTPVKNEVKGAIIKKLQPYLGEAFLVSDFEFGINSITFVKIRAANSASTFSLDLRKIRIGFDPYKVLTSGFDPLKTIQSVTLYNPRVNIYPVSQPTVTLPSTISPEKILQDLLRNIRKLPEIDYVTVVKGEVYWMVTGGDNIPMLTRLDGRINYHEELKEANLDLRGKLLGVDSSSINLFGNINFDDRYWEAKLNLDDCVITSDLPFWRLGFFELDYSRVYGGVLIRNHGFDSDSLQFSGAFRIRDFTASFFHQKTYADMIDIEVVDRALMIKPFDARIEDGRGRFGGSIPDLLKMEVDWTLDVEDFSLDQLVKSHSVFEYVYDGKMGGTGHFSGFIKEMTIDAQIEAPNLLYAVVPFHTCRVNLSYQVKPKQLDFSYLRADFLRWRTQGTGDINFKTLGINLDLNSDIAVPDGYFSLLNGLNGGKITLATDFQGDFNTRHFYGNFDYHVLGDHQQLAWGEGPFTLDDELFRFNLRSSNLAEPMLVKGTIHQVFSDPQVDILDVRSFPVREFTENPVLASAVDGLFTNFYFAGPYTMLRARMNVMAPNRLDQLVTASANIRDIFEYEQKYWGNFKAATAPELLEGRFRVDFTRRGFTTTVDIPQVFKLNLYQGSRYDDPFEGTATLKRTGLKKYLANSSLLNGLIQQGAAQGGIVFNGTSGAPAADFQLTASDFIVNDVGYFNGRFSGRVDDGLLDFDALSVVLNGDSVLSADLAYSFVTDSLQLIATATAIESNFIAETVFEDPSLIRGALDYRFVASGVLDSPRVELDCQLRDGFVKTKPFELIHGAFRDSVAAAGDFWNIDDHRILIPDFAYVNYDEYAAEGQGMLSVDPDGPLDLRVNVTGNVLAELPEIEPFFMNPRTDGRLFVGIGGTRSAPYFDALEININDGSLEFDGVLPPLKNLKAQVLLDPATNFIQIKNLEGTLLDRWARVQNLRPSEAAYPGLESWVFSEVGLDFGVLTLQTDPRGIPISVPELMKAGEIGYWAVDGRAENETFYLAGPADLPLARGKITMNDCRVTFPFESMYEEGYEYDTTYTYNFGLENLFSEHSDYSRSTETADALDYADDPVAGFLVNMRNDLLVVPNRNNRYFVEIPAYVGDVSMDLNIDDTSPGLEFKGRFLDETWQVSGSIASSRGRVEYLDVQFKVEEFGAEFNRIEVFPEVYGRAYTTVRDSTSDFPRDIFLVLYVVDPVTKEEVSKGRWEDFRFKLVSRNPVIGETQEQILGYLGYSVQNIQFKAREVGLTMTENALIRPFFRPIERQIERNLNLDYVRLRSNFASNLFYLSIQDQAQFFPTSSEYFNPSLNNTLDPALLLLQSSELTIGKYLKRNVYLTYTGELVSAYQRAKLGVNHTLSLEYRLLYNLLLEFEFNKFSYNPFYGDDIDQDFRFRFRHSFNF